MTSFTERCRQAWQGWRQWPAFRIAAWVTAVWLLLYLAFERVEMLRGLRPVDAIQIRLSDVLDLLVLPVNVIPVLMTVAAPLMIVSRLKAQMGSWRSFLMPGYRAPHLLVAAAIGAAIFLVMGCFPTALELLRQLEWRFFVHNIVQQWWRMRYDYWIDEFWPSLGDLALVLLAATMTGWLTVWLSAWRVPALIVIGLLGLEVAHEIGRQAWFYFSPANRGAASAIYSLLYEVGGGGLSFAVDHVGRDADLVLRLFALDFLLAAALFLRLGRLSVAGEAISADERVPWLARLLTASRPTQAGAMAAANVWQRARHRRRIGLGHRFVWIVAIYLAALISLSPLLEATNGRWLTDGGYAFGALFAAGVICALAIGLSWPQRFADMREVELLRPAGRDAFAREIGLAMLADAAEICLATLSAVLIPIAFWTPAVLTWPPFWNAVAALILSQALLFGALVWTMRLRATAAPLVALLASIILLSVLMDQAMDNHFLTPALVAGAIGIALSADAYRRWLKGDEFGRVAGAVS
jgi:hypothetical protein